MAAEAPLAAALRAPAEPAVQPGAPAPDSMGAACACPSVPIVTEGKTWEDLKKEATERYMADDFPAAIAGYGAAAKAFEAEKGDEPEAPADRKALAILYANRAMAALQVIKREQAGKKCSPQSNPLPAELRKLAMRANVDASNAVELDPENAKAWLRKGQALLWMSAMPQRAKESMLAIEKAKSLPSLPGSMKKEVEQWHKYARAAFDNQTPMPENCPQQ